MISTTIFPGRYVQGRDALTRLGDEAATFGDTAFVISTPFAYENLRDDIETSLEGITSQIVRFGGESSDEEISRLKRKAEDAEVVIGVGGGKTLDTTKAVAYDLDVPVIVAPTIASTDAPCSALSVIYTPEGVVERYLTLPRNPDVVLVDTTVIAEAPARFLVAGIGDALSTWFEASACKQNCAGNMTGDVGSATAYRLARFCYETILEYGREAKVSCEANAVTPALERVVEANTLLSGIGFESGGIASSHAIHNGLTRLPATHDFWHGEKVAIGVLASLFLTDKPSSRIDEVYQFCEDVGLPTTLAEIGLEDVSDADLMTVAEAACADGETVHNEPMSVTPDAVFAALRAADAEGRRRKAVDHTHDYDYRNNGVVMQRS